MNENKEKLMELMRDEELEIVAVEHPNGGMDITAIGGSARKEVAQFVRDNCKYDIIEDFLNREDIIVLRIIRMEKAIHSIDELNNAEVLMAFAQTGFKEIKESELYPGEYKYLQSLGLLPEAYGIYEIERARNYLKDMTEEQIEEHRIAHEKAEIEDAERWKTFQETLPNRMKDYLCEKLRSLVDGVPESEEVLLPACKPSEFFDSTIEVEFERISISRLLRFIADMIE